MMSVSSASLAFSATILFAAAFSWLCSDCCELPIRKINVEAAWQSSSVQPSACFHTRSAEDEALAVGTDRFFLTALGGNEMIKWFAVKFTEPLQLASVTVVSGTGETAHRASENIEIWVSDSTLLDFGVEHCASTEILRLFTGVGTTRSSCRIAVRADGNQTAACDARSATRFLIILKEDSRPLGFADLRIQLQSPEDRLSGKLRVTSVSVNSSFSVQCPESCGRWSGMSLRQQQQQQLCLPNGSCLATSRIVVDLASPADSGDYRCREGPAAAPELVASIAVAHASPFSLSPPLFLTATIAVVVILIVLVAASTALIIRRKWSQRHRQQLQGTSAANRPALPLGAVWSSVGPAGAMSTKLPAVNETYADAFYEE